MVNEQLEQFYIQYEEGYNIYVNLYYILWLELHHPESLFDNYYSQTSASDESHQILVVEHFLSILTEVPLVNTDDFSTDDADTPD